METSKWTKQYVALRHNLISSPYWAPYQEGTVPANETSYLRPAMIEMAKRGGLSWGYNEGVKDGIYQSIPHILCQVTRNKNIFHPRPKQKHTSSWQHCTSNVQNIIINLNGVDVYIWFELAIKICKNESSIFPMYMLLCLNARLFSLTQQLENDCNVF